MVNDVLSFDEIKIEGISDIKFNKILAENYISWEQSSWKAECTGPVSVVNNIFKALHALIKFNTQLSQVLNIFFPMNACIKYTIENIIYSTN